MAQIAASSLKVHSIAGKLDDPVLQCACIPEPKPHYKLNILKAYRVLELIISRGSILLLIVHGCLSVRIKAHLWFFAFKTIYRKKDHDYLIAPCGIICEHLTSVQKLCGFGTRPSASTSTRRSGYAQLIRNHTPYVPARLMNCK